MTPTPINMTDEYQTRDGRKVRVLCVDAKSSLTPFCVIALVDYGSAEEVQWLTIDGKASKEDAEPFIVQR